MNSSEQWVQDFFARRNKVILHPERYQKTAVKLDPTDSTLKVRGTLEKQVGDEATYLVHLHIASTYDHLHKQQVEGYLSIPSDRMVRLDDETLDQVDQSIDALVGVMVQLEPDFKTKELIRKTFIDELGYALGRSEQINYYQYQQRGKAKIQAALEKRKHKRSWGENAKMQPQEAVYSMVHGGPAPKRSPSWYAVAGAFLLGSAISVIGFSPVEPVSTQATTNSYAKEVLAPESEPVPSYQPIMPAAVPARTLPLRPYQNCQDGCIGPREEIRAPMPVPPMINPFSTNEIIMGSQKTPLDDLIHSQGLYKPKQEALQKEHVVPLQPEPPLQAPTYEPFQGDLPGDEPLRYF